MRPFCRTFDPVLVHCGPCRCLRFLSRNADDIPLANRPGLIVVSVFLLGYLIFRDGFNDQYHGYRAGFSYRTYDSINWLIAKSILRMIVVYTLFVGWGLRAIGLGTGTQSAATEAAPLSGPYL